jgi:hypothetical protein
VPADVRSAAIAVHWLQDYNQSARLQCTLPTPVRKGSYSNSRLRMFVGARANIREDPPWFFRLTCRVRLEYRLGRAFNLVVQRAVAKCVVKYSANLPPLIPEALACRGIVHDGSRSWSATPRIL